MRLYQRGERGIWWVDLGDIAGQRARRSTGTTDRAQAAEYAATLARDLWRTRRLGETPRVTWDAAVLAWLADHQHRRSIEEIKRNLRWLTTHLRGKHLDEITDGTIRQMAGARRAQAVNRRAIARAVDAGNPVPDVKPTSGATLNRHLAQLSAVLHYAQRRGWLASVPQIHKAHEPSKRVAWLTHEQADKLLAQLPPHLAAMARFALATGLMFAIEPLPSGHLASGRADALEAQGYTGAGKCWLPPDVKDRRNPAQIAPGDANAPGVTQWAVLASHSALQAAFDDLALQHGPDQAGKMLPRICREAGERWIYRVRLERGWTDGRRAS